MLRAIRLLKFYPFAFCLLFLATPALHATIVTATMTGTVTSGSDSGVFGKGQQANLSGQSVKLVFSFDDSKGVQTIVTVPPNGVTCDESITSTTTSSPGTATLQVGTGTPYSFGISTDPSLLSSVSLRGGACQVLGSQQIVLNYSVVEDFVGGGGDSIIGDIGEQGAAYAADASWEYSFTATPVIGPFTFLINTQPDASGGAAQSAYGGITITNVTVAGPGSTAPVTGLRFVPVTPCRVADTRNATGAFGGPALAANASREFDIPQSSCSIPSTAVAYSLNVTAVPNGPLNYLTMWPSGQAQPGVSTLNSDGRVKANAAIVPAGSNGGVSLFVTNSANAILDIDGYFVPSGGSSGLAFYPLTPCRVVDTRNPTAPLGGPSLAAKTSRDFPVQSGGCAIPSDASAYSFNVTTVPRTTLGYLSIWPTGSSQPNVSTLNAPTGTVTANAAIVPAGASGAVSVYATDTSDVIIDVNGYFAAASGNGLSLYTVTPCRVLDTRNAAGALNGTLSVAVENSPCAAPSAAQAYVLNATVVPSGPLGYLTLWPAGENQPSVSTLNATDGALTSNMAIAPTLNGSVSAFSSGATQLIVDLSSYFAP